MNQGKLEARVRNCMFLGYLEGVKGYKLRYKDGTGSKTMISRDVTFREDQMYMVDCKKNGDQLIGSDSSEGTVELELTGDLDQHQFETRGSQDGQTSDEQESLQSYHLTRDKIRR